ncbi:hypothetical protein D3C76_194140 [compost metagenome]
MSTRAHLGNQVEVAVSRQGRRLPEEGLLTYTDMPWWCTGLRAVQAIDRGQRVAPERCRQQQHLGRREVQGKRIALSLAAAVHATQVVVVARGGDRLHVVGLLPTADRAEHALRVVHRLVALDDVRAQAQRPLERHTAGGSQVVAQVERLAGGLAAAEQIDDCFAHDV